MRHLFLVFSLLITTAYGAYGQILGAELVPHQKGDTVGFVGSSYHYCTDTVSPTDSFTAYIVYGTNDTLIQEFRAQKIVSDTLKSCSDCGCSSNCKTPSIVRTRFFYSFQPQNLGLKNACHVRAFFSPGKRFSDIDFAPKAQNTYLLVSAHINTCGPQTNRSFEFALPPKFYGIQNEYFIHSSGFQQVLPDSIGHFDSISADFADVYGQYMKLVEYRNGYDIENPVRYNGYPNKSNAFPRGFHLNAATGDYRFIPTDTGASVLKVGYTTYDSSETSYSEREWLVQILPDASETVPVLTGLGTSSFLDASNYEYNLCFNTSKTSPLRIIDKDGPGIDLALVGTSGLSSKFQWNLSNDTIYLSGNLDSIHTGERPLRLFFNVSDSSCTPGSNSSYTVLLYNNPFPEVAPGIGYTGQRTFALKSNPTPGKGAQRYQWQFNGITYNQQDTIAQLKQPGTYNFKHIAFGKRGCHDTTTSSYQSPDFPYISINETQLTPCAGDTIELSVSFFHAPSPPRYLWLNSKGGKNIEVITVQDSLITVQADFVDGTSNFDTIFIPVTQAPLPNIVQSTRHCEGNILSLEANYPRTGFADSATQYRWIYNNRLAGTLPDVQIQDEGTLTLEIGYSNGCKRTQDKNVVYDLLYTPGRTVYPYCPSQDTIHFKIDTLSGLSSYWYLNKIQVAQGTDTYNMTNLEDNKEIVLVGLYIDSNLYCRFIDTLRSTLLEEDTINFSGRLEYCDYESIVDLMDSSLMSPSTGKWLDSLNNEVTLLDGRYFDPTKVPTSREQVLIYEVEHSKSKCISRQAFEFEVHPKPVISYMIDTLQLCIDNKDYNMNTSEVAVPPNGIWAGNGIISRNGTYYFSTAQGTGIETINRVDYTYIDTNGCRVADSTEVKLGLVANPVVLSSTTGEVPITINFTDDRSNIDCDVDSWLWVFGDHMAEPNCTTNVDTLLKEHRHCAYGLGQDVQHIYRDGGQYKVKLYVKNTKTGVTDSATYDSLSLTVGINEHNGTVHRVVVYPNPIHDHFTISQDTRMPFRGFELYSLLGQPVLQKKLFLPNERIEISEALQGLYLLVLRDENGQDLGHYTLLFE